MSRRAVICWAGLPVFAVAAYFATWWLAPVFFFQWVASERGVVEIGTALLFVAAASMAMLPALAKAADLAAAYRMFYALFAAAALFVALEEISYGQHFFGWQSPEVFRRYNQQGELNLHNLLGSKPSKRMHMLADWSAVLGLAVLPILLATGRRAAMTLPLPGLVRQSLRRAYAPGTWSYCLVPGMQLITLVVLARLVGWLKRIPGAGVDHNELREFLWAWAACGYAVVMHRRLLGAGKAGAGP